MPCSAIPVNPLDTGALPPRPDELTSRHRHGLRRIAWGNDDISTES
jgi:hypothetical protein